jgi:hypothetical protein
MMGESKTSRARVAFVLLCGLAVCCSIMYITADASEEVVLAEDAKHLTGSGQDTFTPASVDSTDVMKTGLLYTKTPDTLKQGKEGRERLLTFLDKIEANIAKEVESRKADIAAIRARMAKNMEYNADARKKMKKALLAKMAVNAKIAKDNLHKQMRLTQRKFAKAASLENKRWKETIKRSKKTREIMRKNKVEGAKELQEAVENQQKALATLASATNAKIKKTNKHIAINAAQIKENAKKARQDLDSAMGAFDNKMANIEEEAKKGRSKLAAQAIAMDKKFRAYANNKIKEVTAQTAKQFHDVRATMAKDRADADAALTHASSRMNAALNAAKLLQNKRFAQSVEDIAAAKKEANDRVSKFRASFKTDILKLTGVVGEQTKKLNNRVTQLSGTIMNNKLEQAKVNSAVDKELKNMVKIGNDRYAEHLAKDKELKGLMAKNKAATTKAMDAMALKFYAAIDAIKAQMKKDRASAEAGLSRETGALYDTLKKNKMAQDKANKELTEATRRAKLDAEAALKEAKAGFTEKVAGLHKTVDRMAVKHNAKIMKLTGVVAQNAIKDADGRAELRKISAFNKAELKNAVRDAIHKGEQRALSIEKKMKAVNKKTRADLNMRIDNEISKLSKSIHSQINELNLETKEARAQMKKEILYAVESESKLAKENLKKVVEWAEGEFSKLNAGLKAEKTKSEGERAALAANIAKEKKHAIGQINNAVAAQNKALLALTQETEQAVKKTNHELAAQANIMIKNAEKVRAEMKANTAAINSSLEAARKSAAAELAAVSAASAARYNAVVKAVEDGVDEARKLADEKFSAVYIKMGNDRKHFDEALAGATAELNDKIAAQSALEDARFSKTVKNLKAARAEAAEAVAAARKEMTAGIAVATATIKQVETRLNGDIQDVSAMVISDTAAQVRINKHVNAEIGRLVKFSDKTHTANKAARGVIRKIMDENKAAAAEEVANLAKEANAAIGAARSQQAAYLRGFKKDLTEATEGLYGKLAKDSATQQEALSELKGSLATAKADTAAALSEAKSVFASRVDSLTNAITANAKSFEHGLEKATGVMMDWKTSASKDRGVIRKMRKAMVADLNKNIVRAIQLGEAKAKAVQERAMENIATEKKALLTTISSSVENMADNVFKAVQEGRHKIADNFLSLKAYATTAADKITDYLAKGKGRNLASIGDLLQTVAVEDVKVKPAQGEGFGAAELPLIFSGEEVKVDNSVSKINGLVNEYIKTMGQVKARWPMGLGKYLLSKLEIAMQKTGALEVDKIAEKAGNYVFINAHAVGLSSKLSDFESLAVAMPNYEKTLASLTGTLTTKKTAGQMEVPPPEWQGN